MNEEQRQWEALVNDAVDLKGLAISLSSLLDDVDDVTNHDKVFALGCAFEAMGTLAKALGRRIRGDSESAPASR